MITESGISATHLVERRCRIWNECNMTHDEGGLLRPIKSPGLN